jgi:hypothetical protein
MGASPADPFGPLLSALLVVIVWRIGTGKRWPISLGVAPRESPCQFDLPVNNASSPYIMGASSY